MKIKITADRIIDLSVEELERLNISTMSCYVNMGGKSYEDMIDITPDDVFEHYKKTGELAKTAAKSPEAYQEFFTPFAGEGKAIIHFSASSGISALYNNTVKAAESFKDVYVIDTRSLSSGVALLAKHALDLIAAGETDSKKVYESCLVMREKLQSSFLIQTLEYLFKGGRCSGLRYFAANLLKIKPVITMNKETGVMGPREKIRGQIKNSLAAYIKNTFEKYPDPDLKRLSIVHYSKDPELIQYFVDTATQYYPFESVEVNTVGCNCSIHSGPNTFGMFYFQK